MSESVVSHSLSATDGDQYVSRHCCECDLTVDVGVVVADHDCWRVVVQPDGVSHSSSHTGEGVVHLRADLRHARCHRLARMVHRPIRSRHGNRRLVNTTAAAADGR